MCRWGKRYFNRIFQVIQFEVKQGGGEQVFDAAALEDGKITVEVTLHYITLHCITLHYIILHHITWYRTYIYMLVHYITLTCITLHYIHAYMHT